MERIMIRAWQTETIVVVDECFLDFTDGPSAKRFLPEMQRLCILKAFTKIYAMAGLRLGYMITSDTSLLQMVNTAAQCWSVSVPAQIAGTAALTCETWAEKTRRLIKEERKFLSANLENLGIKVFKTDANYLLFRSEHPLYEMLLQKGIMIRSCENFRELDSSYYRIGIKKRRENALLIQTIKELI
jgi:threonine-phosphate decarboxylase